MHIIDDTADIPSSMNLTSSVNENTDRQAEQKKSFLDKLFGFFKNGNKSEPTLRETLEDYIDETSNDKSEPNAISLEEKTLLSNILQLRELSVVDVMVPRADIVAVDIETTKKDLLALLADKQYSRIPVFRRTLDDILGTIHIKDVFAALSEKGKFDTSSLIRETPIVSPAMPVLDLLMQMRESNKHMAFVVDEFGGIDGLITINDIIESIVGELDDEHEQEEQPELIEQDNDTYIVDARYDLEDFEEKFGAIFSEKELEENDTLAGLVSFLAGRLPIRGEIITHNSGMIFEVMDADPRRISKLRIKKIPKSTQDDTTEAQ